MRITVVLDDDLLAEAASLTGLSGTALVREALKALVERESVQRLVSLGGRNPEAESPPR